MALRSQLDVDGKDHRPREGADGRKPPVLRRHDHGSVEEALVEISEVKAVLGQVGLPLGFIPENPHT